MTRILVIDDHPVLSEGIKKVIDDSGIAVVTGIAATGKAGLKMLGTEEYDLVLLDISLPDGNGTDFCKMIHEEYPSVKIVAITSFGEYMVVHRMLENGASGYILKNAMPEEILKGIGVVMQGDIFLCHEVDMLVKKQAQRQVFLTPRETDLLKLIVQGYTNPEIAEKLFLGVETVNSYRKNLLFKLDARNTAVLVKMAIEQKYV